MNRNSLTQSPPIVIHEKSRENQSKDLAAIIQAASKSNSVLSSVWLKRRENHFRMEFAHVGISGISSGLVVGVCAFFLGASPELAIGLALGSVILSAIAIVLLVFQNADTLEYEVEYQETNQQNESSERVTYKIETQIGRNQTFRKFPDWFNQPNLNALINMNNQGVPFSRTALSKHGVCTTKQFPVLRNNLEHSKMLLKSGKSWELTPAFFAFAKQEIA